MKKKFQIFISSTFTDLISERQSAVEAVLRAGHIPAGMELFSASNKSQLETIKKWILESDIYLLILGGRYGSIEEETGLSYTELEYQYAFELGKPLFAIVLDDKFLDHKVKENGKEMLEFKNQEKYEAFKKNVLSKICRIVKDESEIKLSILESIIDIQNSYDISGWVKSEEIPDSSYFLKEISILRDERDLLIKKNDELETLTKKSSKNTDIGDYTFDEIYKVLKSKKIKIPLALTKDGKDTSLDSLSLFIASTSNLSSGVSSRYTGDLPRFIVNELVPILLSFGLVERIVVNQKDFPYDKFVTSKLGNKFISLFEVRSQKD